MLCGAGEAAAQMPGVPVLSPGRPNTSGRLALYGLAGGGTRDGSGSGWAAALQASYLLGERLTLAGGAGGADANAAGWQAGAQASAAFTVFTTRPAGSPRHLPAVALVAGAGGTLGGDAPDRRLVVGAALDLVNNLRGLFVELWALPRVQLRRVERDGVTLSQSGPGVSLGARIGLATGAALVLALDHSVFGEATGGQALAQEFSPTTFAAGLRLVLQNRPAPGGAP